MKSTVCAFVVVVSLLGMEVGAQQKARANARRIATDHLQMTTYATDAVVAPGVVFSLVFEIAPREGIHLYAPGEHGYKVVRVNLEPNPWLVTQPVEYPASEIYFFAPLKERVPVFQKPFTLRQAISVSTAPEHRAALAKASRMTIKGTLDYQACDDRVCFLPKSIPVSYTVRLRRAP